MDGLTAVHSRIGQIQARFTPPVTQQAAWASAASAAGLTGSSAASATAGSTAATGTGAEVVGAATKYLGVPYKWGGTDPATGLDCSGFTQRVYADLGISIPRTSAQQATAGRPVASLAEAQPGDLVFFDNTSSRPGIDHVGLYIGGGKMIAAPQAGDVVKVQDVGNPTLIRRVLPEGASTTPVAPAAGGGLAGVPYADLFAQAGARHGVSPALLAAVAKTESGFNSSARSSAGATGLMQFMPATAKGLGVDALDPASSIDGAARYLSSLTKQFGSTELALAAYNAGPGTVQRHGGIPPYPETQSYVQKVTRAAEAYA
ncbi:MULTISPECIES: transglycosylase SLT domain-containing protein [unclassified Modestobacter]|uniref:transglycosylase SLT domain-containing protein n=1 Tax=unclassified Modestobacter TaxID=2643866 RepID=UPI0022AAFDDE|nr:MULTISPECIES: transglycosylase SLT domain-containing protein [unclassified Modestobacter]MCZ2825111.1 transglycosylase SLT domain-containing protein [Modestobacter sp. VKM Ac-2981]MCZ2853824.1 transglycosylase SLT domain-containing protein [Modestobacter sp. VKM Ac-2982]